MRVFFEVQQGFDFLLFNYFPVKYFSQQRDIVTNFIFKNGNIFSGVCYYVKNIPVVFVNFSCEFIHDNKGDESPGVFIFQNTTS